DRGECPTTENSSHNSLLVPEERRLVHHKHVVYELAIEPLQPIHGIEIKGIVCSVLARSLDEGSCSHCFGPGEVRLHRQAVPLIHSHGSESRVVISVADTGINTHTA